MVTTPTLVYIVSKISDLTTTEVTTAVLAQCSVILTGLIASIVPSPYKCKDLIALGLFSWIAETSCFILPGTYSICIDDAKPWTRFVAM